MLRPHSEPRTVSQTLALGVVSLLKSEKMDRSSRLAQKFGWADVLLQKPPKSHSRLPFKKIALVQQQHWNRFRIHRWGCGLGRGVPIYFRCWSSPWPANLPEPQSTCAAWSWLRMFCLVICCRLRKQTCVKRHAVDGSLSVGLVACRKLTVRCAPLCSPVCLTTAISSLMFSMFLGMTETRFCRAS